MNKQAGAIVVSILFAVGTAGASYAADTTDPMKSSDPKKVEEGVKGTQQPLNTEEQKGVKSPAAPAKAAPEKAAPEAAIPIPPSVVTGELLKIDGKNYVVKDQSGKEVTFQLDQRTKMNARPNVGDQIRAELAPQGYAHSINMASDSTQAGTPDKKRTDPPAKSDQPQTRKK